MDSQFLDKHHTTSSVYTFSLLSTIFWTMRSTRSNSGHMLVQVPTGVIA
jgi:hypothetical protein